MTHALKILADLSEDAITPLTAYTPIAVYGMDAIDAIYLLKAAIRAEWHPENGPVLTDMYADPTMIAYEDSIDDWYWDGETDDGRPILVIHYTEEHGTPSAKYGTYLYAVNFRYVKE